MDYLSKKTEREIRDSILAALAALRVRHPTQSSFEYGTLVYNVAREISTGPEVSSISNQWLSNQTGMMPGCDDECPDNRKLLAAIWGLVGDGLVFPRLKSRTLDGYPHLIDRLVLTERGDRVVANNTDHPLRPGFLTRLRARAPNVNEEVLARFEDAITCLERSVPRAAVVMIGLASEESIRVAHGALHHIGLVKPSKNTKPVVRDLLGEVKLGVEGWANKEEAHRLKMAVLAAEMIRGARNEASHPGAAEFDSTRVENLLVQGAYGLPIFWEIPIKAAVDKGYSQ